MKKGEQEPLPETVQNPVYAKQQILESKQFTPLEKDVLSALLADNERYTIDKAKQMIEEFAKGEAN
ncbi:hypothetical protein Back11_11720 [Paenibacillus baekrokdamisoli]|uniref:Uncharacterized protein n=1 Tax=Paenibacillus baekrokdamisoli TaxID=1712516 RepID=A0A3G9ILK2_9BACL|nr:hypothetical protein [Paenibacillus baekrokdamisoli]MBB3070477.1 hypothetical protein [Paenibacillus baekrokdamisoli]BBH19827.1 hypothetical protein Back11_11720 [Paenibacillus baekrokdamisoli]